MTKLLIIADEFTGALDTGVQLAARGAATRVLTGPVKDMGTAASTEILVVDAETRHLPPWQAGQTVAAVVEQALAVGIPYIYKKTDSALRGNIGAELEAVCRFSGGTLPFFPAFPRIGRCTVGGVHYIEGVPVAQSVFGKDPFEPVTESRVTDLIALQSDLPAVSLPPLGEASPMPAQTGILVFDAQTQEELLTTGRRMLREGGARILAGCAGFAAALPELLGIGGGGPAPLPALDRRLLVLCGSVNPITLAQLDAAEQAGFLRVRMRPEQKLDPDHWSSEAGRALLAGWIDRLGREGHAILDSNDVPGGPSTADRARALGLDIQDVRVRVSHSLGRILGALMDSQVAGTLLITGGDTLLQCMNEIGVHEMEPLRELASGVVLSRFEQGGRPRYLISKSGGFGAPSLLADLADLLENQTTCHD